VVRTDHPKTVYVKEESLLSGLDQWLGELFDPEHLDATCEALAEASQPDLEETQRREEMVRRVAELQRELDRYREIVRNESDSTATVGRWIAETSREKQRLETMLGQPVHRLTTNNIKALVGSLKDITSALAGADPGDKASVYAEMGITTTNHPEGRVLLESRPGAINNSVGGATRTLTPPGAPAGEFPAAA
jgi:hypothetical protein